MKPGPQDVDRRKFARIEASYITDYRLLGKGNFEPGQLVDLSPVGIRFQARRRFSPSDRVELKLWPPQDAGFIQLQGDVIWCQQLLPHDNLYETGILLGEMKEGIRLALEDLLKLSDNWREPGEPDRQKDSIYAFKKEPEPKEERPPV